MGPRLVCLVKPDESGVCDLQETRLSKVRRLVLDTHQRNKQLLLQDSSVPQCVRYGSCRSHSVPPRLPLLCLHTDRGVPTIRLLHFPALNCRGLLNPLVKSRMESELDFLRRSVPFLSAEELDSLEVGTDITPGSYAMVQTVTFRGRLAIRKVMLSDSFLELLLREARVLLQLAGAGGAPRVLAMCTEPPAILLEFVGATFREFLSECSDVAVLLDSLAKVCDQVHEIHENGFIHCDLKANNITVSGEWHNPDVHIIDFGLATPIGQPFDSKFAGIEFHSKRDYLQHWMSPEMKAGERLRPSSDVYSLGVLMIRMTVIANDAGLTSAVTSLLMACTHPDPDKRPTLPDVAACLRDLRLKVLHKDTPDPTASRWSRDTAVLLGNMWI
ncbi:tyrosine-protein kinase Yes-like [Scylla paramamosain]|uniref:tyrosine-protein kinase Yes-like n=1 Tax=Scylla paramamosain TaxID=85552 RepID=UPI003082E4A0